MAARPIDEEVLADGQAVTCPISLAPMMDPVKLRVSGCVFELKSIERHLSTQRDAGQPLTCPCTRLVVSDYGNHLEPLPELKARIEQWCLDRHTALPTEAPIDPTYLGLLAGSDSQRVRLAAVLALEDHLMRGLSFEVVECLYQQVMRRCEQDSTQRVETSVEFHQAVAWLVAVYVLSERSKDSGEPRPLDYIARVLLEWFCVPQAIELLKCPQPELQAQICRVLVVLHPYRPDILVSSAAPAALIRVLRSSQEPAVQQAAAAAIHSMYWAESDALHESTRRALLDTAQLLSSAATSDQASALTALQHMMTCRQCKAPGEAVAELNVLPQLVQLLTSPCPTVQQAALTLISHLSSCPTVQLQLVECGFLNTVPHLASGSSTLRTTLAKVLTHSCARRGSQVLTTAMCQAFPLSTLHSLLHKCRSPVLRAVLKQALQHQSDAQQELGVQQPVFTKRQLRTRSAASQAATPATEGARKRGRDVTIMADAQQKLGEQQSVVTKRRRRTRRAAAATAGARKRVRDETDTADAAPEQAHSAVSSKRQRLQYFKVTKLVDSNIIPETLRLLQTGDSRAQNRAGHVFIGLINICAGALAAAGVPDHLFKCLSSPQPEAAADALAVLKCMSCAYDEQLSQTAKAMIAMAGRVEMDLQ